MGICRRKFAACLSAGLAAGAYALKPRPKLLVLVVLEQLRQDSFDSLSPQFSSGGLRRLLSKGAHFPDCRHLASTFSSSALATLATGAWPSQHGIVADSWYDRSAKNAVPASSEALLATTLCAQVAADPHNRAFVIARDGAQAGLVAGTSQARQYWMNPLGQFTTLGDMPDWLVSFNNLNPIEKQHDATWTAMGARSGAPPLRTLTWDAEHPREFLNLYNASPLAQEAQFDFLAELISLEGLGKRGSFDFVCLVAGATALLGYETGGRHPLMQQMVLELDRRIEILLRLLGRAVGETGFNLVLAAAHGAPPAPPEEARGRMAVNGESVASLVDHSLMVTGMGRVSRYLYPFLYLDTSGFREPEPVRGAAARAAMEHPAVSGYYTAGGLCSTQDGWEPRFRNSFHPQRSGDVMLSYRPEYVEEFGQGRGVSYGSLYNYDVRVPLCFYGPQFEAGVFEAAVELVDVAPTLARVMGVAVPSSCTGRVLGEAFAE
jgi:hypothetical protein